LTAAPIVANIPFMEQEFHKVGRGRSTAVEPAAPEAGRGTQAIDRAARLLVAVLQSEGPVSLSDLAADNGLPKSTASRLASALERHGLLQQDGVRGRLAPGPALLRFAHRGAVEGNLVELSREALRELADASGETVNLAVPSPGGVEHLAQADGQHFLGTGQWLDRRVDFHCTAGGKVFLAFGAAAIPLDGLEALTPATITGHDELEAELARIRRQGYATAIDELEPGLTAIAAPVRGHAGEVIAAISVSGPTLRLQPHRLDQLRPELIKEARAISRRLGHHHEGEEAA
jgi:IclR family transcriptional regulator, acetate operon repressor